MYHNIFAIDPVSFRERKVNNEESPLYHLNNFNYYLPKLEQDFYLKYFLRVSLFDTKTRNLKEYITGQYDYCNSPDEFISVIDYEVIPHISDIIENAHFSLEGNGYYDEKKLENGFIETEGVIKNSKYDFPEFYHLAALKNLKTDLTRRKEIFKSFLTELEEITDNQNEHPLKWIAGPSELGFIIRSLIDAGYMEGPEHKNGELNCSQLARDLFRSFTIKNHNSLSSLTTYLNSASPKHKTVNATFKKQKFNLPNRKML